MRGWKDPIWSWFMLEGLFGSKNVEKILLFLFVNGKCYGTQLQNQLKTSLTPLQKALQRLEKAGIVKSSFEGKTRVYQFDPMFPYLEELEPLLKKAYTLMPTIEKKQYYIQEEIPIDTGTCLEQFWNSLSKVSKITFHAKSNSKQEGGWNGKGIGDVKIIKENEATIIFDEKGQWHNQKQEKTTFSNIFRWKLERKKKLISLEHLRLGKDNPVFLCHLAPTGPTTLASVNSHLCNEDIYYGKIYFTQNYLRLKWRVIGPKKNEEMDYCYEL